MSEEKIIFGFEKLLVWQKAMELTVDIYKLTEKFPRAEQFSLTDQIRRATSAVAANITEGNARKTGKDKAHFTIIAFSSLMETMNHIILAFKLNYIHESTLDMYRIKIKEIASMLSSLQNYQLSHL